MTGDKRRESLTRSELIALLGVLAAFIAIALPIQFPRLFLSKKGIAVYQSGADALMPSRLLLSGELKLLAGSRELKNSYVATLKIQNTGNFAILADQVRFLRVHAGNGRQFVSAKTTETSAMLVPNLKISGEYLDFDNLTLNRDQSITVVALIEGGDPIFSVDGDVLDASRPTFAVAIPNKDRTMPRVVAFSALGLATFAVVFLNLFEAVSRWRRRSRNLDGAATFQLSFLFAATCAVCAAGGHMAMRKAFDAADLDDPFFAWLAFWGVALALAAVVQAVAIKRRNLSATGKAVLTGR